MKFILIVVAVVVGIFVYNVGKDAYDNYKHRKSVEQCQKEVNAPNWAKDFSKWGCDRFTH